MYVFLMPYTCARRAVGCGAPGPENWRSDVRGGVTKVTTVWTKAATAPYLGIRGEWRRGAGERETYVEEVGEEAGVVRDEGIHGSWVDLSMLLSSEQLVLER